jgi:hypothetical protein
MKNNQLIYNIQDNKIKLSFAKKMSIEEAIQVTMTGLLGMMNSIISQVPPSTQTEAKEDLYDMFNAAASQTLSFFAPEIELRPTLTTEAILKAEDDIINQLYKKHKETGKDVSLADLKKEGN